MRLFSKIAYHSTTQKGLKKFEDFTSEDKAFTGEGAQVHGWGLYLQEDKEINIERYKNTLSEGFRPTVIITDKSGNEYIYKAVDFKRSRSSDFNFTLNGKLIEPKSYLDKILNSICYPYGGYKNELINNIQSNLDWIEKQLKQLEIDKQYYTNKNEMTKTFIYDSRYHNEGFYDKEGHYHDKVDEDEFYEQRNNFIDELSNNPSLDEIDYFYNLYKDLIDHVIKIKSDYCDERFNHLQKQLKFYKKQLDFLNTHEFEVKWEIKKSSQYEVEIPDDFVFLEEDTPIDEQNILMLPSLLDKYKLLTSKTSHEIVKHFQDKYPQVNPEIFEDMSINYCDDNYTTVDEVNRYLSTQYGYQDWGYRNLVEPKDGKLATFEDFQRADEYIQHVIADFLANISIKRYVTDGRDLYQVLYNKLGSYREVSEILYNYGIDGIKYEGGLDGQCYVIFSCKELKILNEET